MMPSRNIIADRAAYMLKTPHLQTFSRRRLRTWLDLAGVLAIGFALGVAAGVIVTLSTL